MIQNKDVVKDLNKLLKKLKGYNCGEGETK